MTGLKTQRNLAFLLESLESRRLLAGIVAAEINNAGDLIISGDRDDNDLEVDIDVFGNVSIEGRNGTVIDEGNLATSQVSGDIRINLRGGNDELVLSTGQGAFAFENLVAQMGTGNDYFGLIDFAATGGVTVVSGAGEDVTNIREGEIDGDVRISSGGGHDINSVGTNTVLRNLSMHSGAGNDDNYFYGAIAHGRITITTGRGNDAFEATSACSGCTADSPQPFSVRTGSGDDLVYARDMSVMYLGLGTALRSPMQISTGGGRDRVSILEIFGDATISTGAGDDTISINSHQGICDVKGGGGFDQLNLSGSGDNLTLTSSSIEDLVDSQT